MDIHKLLISTPDIIDFFKIFQNLVGYLSNETFMKKLDAHLTNEDKNIIIYESRCALRNQADEIKELKKELNEIKKQHEIDLAKLETISNLYERLLINTRK